MVVLQGATGTCRALKILFNAIIVTFKAVK